MSASLYDRALLQKFNDWTEGTTLHVFGPSDVAHVKEVIFDEKKDSEIKLPFITLSRPDGYEISNINKKPMSFSGSKIQSTSEQVTILNAVPILLSYNIDIYTRYLEEADALSREIIFNIINYPKIKVVIPYLGVDFTHESNIRLSSNHVIDNSSAVRNGAEGIASLQIQINIDDAYLWDVRNKATIGLAVDGLNLEIKSSDTDTVTEPIRIV